jgi:hypothetical protein
VTSGWKKGALLLRRRVEHPTCRLHALARGRAEEVKFGRWLGNSAVTVGALVAHCEARVVERVAGLHVLAIQDTTELNYERHAGRTRGLGTVGNGRDRGLFLHPVLAVEAGSRRCLGLVGAEIWARRDGALTGRRRRPIEAKESARWRCGAARGARLLPSAAQVTVIADREGDIYADHATLPGERFHLLTRSAQDRAIAEGGCLFAHTDGLPVMHRYDLLVPPRPGKRRARVASMALRFGRVTLKRPAYLRNSGLPPDTRLSAVDVREVGTAPPGEKPIHWRLLTSHSVLGIGQALQIVDWYRQRWLIELLFWTLKRQGFNIEASQLETAGALMKLAIMATNAATRVMRLVGARDGSDPAPPSELFEPAEIDVIADLQAELQGRTERQKNPWPPGSLAWAAWTIARLGGWKGYSTSEAPPGPLTMRRGLEKFESICHGYRLRRKRSVHR